MYRELNVELYVMSALHASVFAELCYMYGAKDAALNKTLRGLSLLRPGDVEDLNPVFFPALPAVQVGIPE